MEEKELYEGKIKKELINYCEKEQKSTEMVLLNILQYFKIFLIIQVEKGQNNLRILIFYFIIKESRNQEMPIFFQDSLEDSDVLADIAAQRSLIAIFQRILKKCNGFGFKCNEKESTDDLLPQKLVEPEL